MRGKRAMCPTPSPIVPGFRLSVVGYQHRLWDVGGVWWDGKQSGGIKCACSDMGNWSGGMEGYLRWVGTLCPGTPRLSSGIAAHRYIWSFLSANAEAAIIRSRALASASRLAAS